MTRLDRYCDLLDDLEQPIEESIDEAIIVDTILEFEEFLSDGFSYYAPEGNSRLLLFHIAKKILEALE
ncbi:MAG: hypothetical protein AMJ88_13530 [Anaerolineae bacterium SM23_ 63]|nr:MAG: hypothetical protein AMJ88_13530 [Anaerolineae bacterium SM23_ 63]